MPWPATHILVAEKIFDRYFADLDRKAFILGTCFPDIRYPAGIERERTHIKNIPLETIQQEPSFRAGLLFHTYVDNLWNAHIRSHGDVLFTVIPHTRPMFHAMKILQDKWLYDTLTDWSRITAYFATTLPEERQFGASDSLIQRWHEMLASYLSKPPVEDDLRMLALSLTPDLVADIRRCYREFQREPQLIQVMTNFYQEIDELISSNTSPQ
jgi:hypothetical protein